MEPDDLIRSLAWHAPSTWKSRELYEACGQALPDPALLESEADFGLKDVLRRSPRPGR